MNIGAYSIAKNFANLIMHEKQPTYAEIKSKMENILNWINRITLCFSYGFINEI